MNHLLRELAPITEAGWGVIDDEARERLQPGARGAQARRLRRAARLGVLGHEPRAHARRSPTRRARASTAAQRRVLPVVELRAPFSLSRDELRDADRGAEDVDLGALDEAAQRIATAENRAVFHGWEAAGITRDRRGLAARRDRARRGLRRATRATSARRGRDAAARRRRRARTASRSGPTPYTRVLETTEHGGYPLLDHLRKILGGPLVWAPGVEGAVVVSLRGGDFLFESGEDLSIGYDAPRRRRGRALPGGELHLPRRHARGGGGADPVTAAPSSSAKEVTP